MVSPLKRTWARRGQTPIIRTSIEHNRRLNLIGAWCLTPGGRKVKLHLQSTWAAMAGSQVVRFLRHLLKRLRGPILMVWDKHPIHKRQLVTDFLEHHSRIEREWFPTCAPELNPMEFVWTQVSEATASTAPHNAAELQANVQRGVARTRRSQRRLRACQHASGLSWTARHSKHGH